MFRGAKDNECLKFKLPTILRQRLLGEFIFSLCYILHYARSNVSLLMVYE